MTLEYFWNFGDDGKKNWLINDCIWVVKINGIVENN